jgi:hypothetical protein
VNLISLGKSAEKDLEVVEEEAALLDPPQLQLPQQKAGARLFTQLPQASYRKEQILKSMLRIRIT